MGDGDSDGVFRRCREMHTERVGASFGHAECRGRKSEAGGISQGDDTGSETDMSVCEGRIDPRAIRRTADPDTADPASSANDANGVR